MEIQDLPRAVPDNPYKYSKTELAKRKIALKAMERDFPNVNPMWIEWTYDVITNMDEKEVEKIIEEGTWEKQESKYKAIGGVSHAVEVLDPE